MANDPVVPFREAPGVRLVRIDRNSGRRVYGGWPSNDPLSPIIWEQFKPETEPRRSIAKAAIATKAAPKTTAPPRDADFLQKEGGIY
jgi:penicillin-binding protein 1A